MGNQLAQPQKVQQDHLADVPDIVFKEPLGKFPKLDASAVHYQVYNYTFVIFPDPCFDCNRRRAILEDHTLRA